MSHARLRAFLPALLLTIVAALAGSPRAFAQEVSAPRAAEAKTAAPAETAQEQTPAQAPSAARDVVKFDEAKFVPADLADCGCAATQTAAVSEVVKLDDKTFVLRVPRTFGAHPQGQQGGTTSQNNYTPLTSEQKMKRAFKSAFLSPGGYALTAFNATITQLGEEDQPHKDTGDKFADGMSRFAIQFGRRAARSLLGSGVYPVIFKQDPRYFRSDKNGIGPRALYAVSRVFVTRGDNGNSQFNVSRVAGNISASALSNLWERSTPGHDRIGVGPTFRRVGTMFLSDALFNLVREFWR